jgi:hypothetical protein
MGTRSRLLAASVALALLGAPALVGTSAAAAPDPSKGSVSINAAPAVIVGDPVRFTGVVRPRQAGLKVRLQQRLGGSWKSLGQTRTKAGGRYQLSATQPEGGAYQYRVVRLPWLTTSTHSRTVTVMAYGWTDVNTRVAPGAVNVEQWDPARINGVDYPNSLTIDADSQGDPDEGFFEVDLAGLRCAALDATFGAPDLNAPSSVVGARVKVDGTVIHDDTYQHGESEHLVLDVRGADRLRVEGRIVQAGPQGDLGIGNPRLLCAS